MVSLEGLSKVVDPSQLTADFEGSLDYNHEEWIEIRVAFEDFTGNARHLLARLEEMQETVTRKDFPQDLEGARRMIEEHAGPEEEGDKGSCGGSGQWGPEAAAKDSKQRELR